MRRSIVYAALFAALLIGVAGLSLGAGYMAHREQIGPVYGLGERIITRGRRALDMPSATAAMVERVETTYLTFSGETFLMPDQQFKNGGAMTMWDDDLVVLHGSGRILSFDPGGTRLVDADIAVPPNNLAEYVALAASEYPDQFAKEGSIRYNDLEFIDTEVFRGLALSYTFIDIENRCYRNRVDTVPIGEDVTSIRDVRIEVDDWSMLYQTSPCLEFNETRELLVGYMAGGRMAVEAPGTIYLANSEFHREGFYRPDAGIQSDDSDYGKTIRIDLATGEARHLSKGHRNIQGIAVDLEGRVWTTEHGMRGGDELNLI